MTNLAWVHDKSLQSCPTLFDPTDCSWPGFSDHGILQARTLEWIAMPSCRGSSWPRDWTWVSWTAGRFCTIWTTREALDKCRKSIKKQRHYFDDKGPYSQSYGFSSSHVQMWELDHKEGWVPKNGGFQIILLEKTLESPLDYKEIKPVNPKWNQPHRTVAEAEAPILWPPDMKNRLIRKDPASGKDWRQKTEGEMVGWHHGLNGHEFEQALGVDDGSGSLHATAFGVAKSWARLNNWSPQTARHFQVLSALWDR